VTAVQLVWIVCGSVLPALAVAVVTGYVVRRHAERWGLVDHPGRRKVHEKATPLGGGLAIWLALVVPLAAGQFLIWAIAAGSAGDGWAWLADLPLPDFVRPHIDGLLHQSAKLWLLMAAGTVLMLVGLADDLRQLDWRPRLALQVLVAALVVWRGWRLSLFIDAPLLTAALSVVWIVGLVNSFNMLDNMDGLSGGVAVIAASMLAAVLLMAPDPQTSGPQLFVAGLLLVLVGAVAGFLWHNRPPARMFMGDAGSYLIGFLLAVTTIMATFAGGDLPRHAILAPLCVLAVPLYDTTTVVFIRLRAGHSPFQPDRNHLSHRLVALGMTNRQAVGTIYLLTATCGLGALVLHQVNALGAGVILLLVLCVLALVAILETTARKHRG